MHVWKEPCVLRADFIFQHMCAMQKLIWIAEKWMWSRHLWLIRECQWNFYVFITQILSAWVKLKLRAAADGTPAGKGSCPVLYWICIVRTKKILWESLRKQHIYSLYARTFLDDFQNPARLQIKLRCLFLSHLSRLNDLHAQMYFDFHEYISIKRR